MSALSRERPRTVTITLWGVFLLGAWNAARAVSLGLQSDLFLDLGVVFSPRLRMVVAVIWAASFWIMGIMLKKKRSLVRRSLPLLLILYALSELVLLFVFVKSPSAKRSWSLNSLFYVATIIFTYWALNRSAADRYFK